MLGLQIDAPALPRLQARFAQAPQIVGQELRQGMESALETLQRETRAAAPDWLQEQIVGRMERVNLPELSGRLQVLPLPGKPAGLPGWANDGTRPHIIRPRRKKYLRFQAGGRTVYAKSVRHPGTKPIRFMERGREAAEPQIRRIFSARLGNVTRRLGGR